MSLSVDAAFIFVCIYFFVEWESIESTWIILPLNDVTADCDYLYGH